MKNLKILRHNKCLSQQQLADTLHLSQQSIYKYENNIAAPNLETLTNMADFFETSVDYLIGHTEVSHKIKPLAENSLSHNEQLLIEKYRQLPSSTCKAILYAIDEYLSCLSK